MAVRANRALGLTALAVAAVGLWTAAPARACEMADQYRLLLLGDSDKGLVALELDQFRDSKSPTGPRYWAITPRLVYVAEGKPSVTIREYPAVEVSDRNYADDVAPIVSRALADAAKQTGRFHQAEVAQFVDCHYQTRCGGHRVIDGERGARLTSRLDGRDHRLRLRIPESFLRHRNAFPDLEWQDSGGPRADSQDAIDTLSSEQIVARYPEIATGWRLGSVRIYTIGKRRVIVYDLGRGDTRHYRPRGVTARPRLVEQPAGKFVYNEDLPHHGHAFDQIQVIR